MQWLSDIESGHAASSLVSPYQDTRGVRVNGDGMVEVLEPPYKDDNSDTPVAAAKHIDKENTHGVSTKQPLGR